MKQETLEKANGLRNLIESLENELALIESKPVIELRNINSNVRLRFYASEEDCFRDDQLRHVKYGQQFLRSVKADIQKQIIALTNEFDKL